MRIIIVIQARTNSTRLPQKVLLPLNGKTILERVIDRAKKATLPDEVIIATTTQPEDEAIYGLCQSINVKCYRGSANDVLDRYYQVGQAEKADIIVRITSDCPLLDPQVLDQVVKAFLKYSNCDYASNTIFRTYPRGLDCEVISFQALAKAHSEASFPWEREHVTPYIYRHPQLFKLYSVIDKKNFMHPELRFTVDTEEDYMFVRAIYHFLGNNLFYLKDVYELLDKQPWLAYINKSVSQKAL
ncbi:MAG: 3-deoxy-manno-octulosonate cytidylyltransferase [Pelotomaculum sp. PtaB.Bin104]|nr:MAG: 3-deoxy-manno-octulosonate cytidylyltransferase [Pelotomaculum sp. PtaB.Bin104]